MKGIQFIVKFFVLAALAALLSACAHTQMIGSSATLIATNEAFKMFSGEYANTEYFKNHKPRSISVLPFKYSAQNMDDITSDPENPAAIVRKGMYNHIASLPFTDMEIYSTDRLLKNEGIHRISDIERLIQSDSKKLKSILGVDAVVTGDVTHFDRLFLGIYSQVAVGCEVNMWDLNSGNLLWQAKNVSRAHAGGLSISPVGIAMATIASIWNLRQTALYSQTDELFREMVSTIELPESAVVAQMPPPRIDLFAVMNADKPFKLGDKVSFRLIGDPNDTAYVDLGDFKTGISLNPVSPSLKTALQDQVLEAMKLHYKDTGHELTPELIDAVRKELETREIYEGIYTVQPEEQMYGLIAKAYLVNSAGIQQTEIDTTHVIAIDSLPPGEIQELAAEPLDTKIKLVWKAIPDEDLKAYEVHTSDSPISGYRLAATREPNDVLLQNIPNFQSVYVQIRAIDRAGNVGNFSAPVAAMSLPEPDIYDLPKPGPNLEGEISERILLVAEKSPYTIFSNLRIVSNGALYAEPGVHIQFGQNARLTVDDGDILIYGTKDAPVRLTPKNETNVWGGISISGAKRAMIRHALIQKADTGLTITQCSPVLNAITIIGCDQAGIHLRDKAKPNMTCSLIGDNQGMGAMIIEGEGLAPEIHHNNFVNNSPFQVQNYSPLEIDLKDNYWGNSIPEASWFLGNIVWHPALTAPPECK